MKLQPFMFGVIMCVTTGYSQICDDESFTCEDETCIPMASFCNRYDDCGDMSDEPDSCASCGNEAFTCSNGPCIPIAYVCDGEYDCGDGSDEPEDHDKCPACKDNQFRSTGNGKCIPKFCVCDGHNDCEDGSDEYENPDNCPACKNLTEFRCLSGRCLEEMHVCNGINECDDWEDEGEELCPCLVNEIRCNASVDQVGKEAQVPGECIPAEWWCDSEGIVDCADGSDEANCSH